MRLEFDPQLIEESVFLALRQRERAGDGEIVRVYRQEIDPLYTLPLNSPERERGFQGLHRKFFSKLGLRNAVFEVLPRFQIMAEFLDCLVFLKAAKRRQEGAELFVRDERDLSNRTVRSGVVYVLPERFLEQEELKGFLIRELLHISDMVDPEFGYDPVLRLDEDFLPQENLIRDRYRILWEISIQKRLRGWRGGAGKDTERLQGLFRRVFANLPRDTRDSLWFYLLGSECLSHQVLLGIAKSPYEFLGHCVNSSEFACQT